MVNETIPLERLVQKTGRVHECPLMGNNSNQIPQVNISNVSRLLPITGCPKFLPFLIKQEAEISVILAPVLRKRMNSRDRQPTAPWQRPVRFCLPLTRDFVCVFSGCSFTHMSKCPIIGGFLPLFGLSVKRKKRDLVDKATLSILGTNALAHYLGIRPANAQSSLADI